MKGFLGTWLVFCVGTYFFISLMALLFSPRNSWGLVVAIGVLALIPTISLRLWMEQTKEINSLEKRLEKLEQKLEEESSSDI